MKYAKPEMNALGEASKMIQDFTKSVSMQVDTFTGQPNQQVNPAYDLDE